MPPVRNLSLLSLAALIACAGTQLSETQATPPPEDAEAAAAVVESPRAEVPVSHPINQPLPLTQAPLPAVQAERRERPAAQASRQEADRAALVDFGRSEPFAAGPRHKLQSSTMIAEQAWPPAMAPPLPAGFNREGYDAISENRFLSVAPSPFSTFGMDVDTASMANVRRFLNSGRLPPVDAVRIEELVNYFDFTAPPAASTHPLAVSSDYAVCPWNPANRLVMVGLQARELAAAERPPSRLTFLLDTSGSMNQSDKLPLLLRAFGQLSSQLGPQDRVAIVTYAGSAGLVLPPTSGADQAAIQAALGRLRAGGSTAGGAGIELAYRVAQQMHEPGVNSRVLLATDGDFNVGASSQGELVRMIEQRRDLGIYLSVLGFGTGNLQDGRMQALSEAGNGTHHYIDSDQEAQRVFGSKLTGTLHTVAKDVKMQIEWNPAAVSQYRLIGFESRVMAAEDFRDDKKDSGDMGAGHSVFALYEVVPAGGGSAPDIERRYGTRPAVGSLAMELGLVKIRYKAPDGVAGIEFDHLLATRARPIQSASVDLQWASAVAEFGMLLRDSPHKAQASFGSLIGRADALLNRVGGDPLRREFLTLARQASALSLQQAAVDG